jgi:HSP20 family protein
MHIVGLRVGHRLLQIYKKQEVEDMFRRGLWGLGRTIDPFWEMQRLQKEMNDLFSGYGRVSGRDYPAVNAWVGDDEVVATAELPGVDADKLEISVAGDVLTLQGKREAHKIEEGDVYHRQERSFGEFSRSIQLPFQVNADKVEAEYEKGILRVRLPRAEVDKPKKIAVKSEDMGR